MRRSRPAYTLMEIMLVLAIVVVMAGLAWPFLDTLQAGPRLAAATDLIRARLTDARTHAVEDHKAYRFAVKDGTSTFRIAPDVADLWEGGRGGADEGWVFEGNLPDKVFFGAPDAGTSNDWHTVATFEPDGTAAEDVEFTFQTHGAAPTSLRLRAATGSVVTAALAMAVDVH